MGHKLVFQPMGSSGEAANGESLLDCAQRLGVPIESPCGGQSACGKCRVKPVSGELSPMTPDETALLGPYGLAGGIRLACATSALSDAVVSVPDGSVRVSQVVLGGDLNRTFGLEPAIRKYYIELHPPDLDDRTADWERLADGIALKYGLAGLSAAYPVLAGLSSALRDGSFKVTATVRYGKEVVRVEPGYSPGLFGAAFDVGTTTIAAVLCDLETGAVVASDAMTNPQAAMGDDVMTRISYAMTHEGGTDGLRDVLLAALNGMLDNMAAGAAEAGAILTAEDIAEVVFVGNTFMHHSVLGLPVGKLGVYPFTPALTRPFECPASDLGLKAMPGGYAVSLPVLGGFVGSDNAAALISAGPYDFEERLLIVDVGTNGEVDLLWRGRVYAASCATGPAFEGAALRFGMRGSPGAIDKVAVDPDTKEASYTVIGQVGWSRPFMPATHVRAAGICGSGVVDAVAGMYVSGVIDRTGTFVKDRASPRVREGADGLEYVVAWARETIGGQDITISQSDVRAVQLAKAALYAGTRILMSEMGVDGVDRILLAGAFGNYLDSGSALVIGMLPHVSRDRVYSIGNAAMDGARAALLSSGKREEAKETARNVKYVELSMHPYFQAEFLKAMDFPE